MDRQIRSKNATFKVPEYQKRLSGRVTELFSDNRHISASKLNENKLKTQAEAIDAWITKHNISNEAYGELADILDGNY